MKDLSSLKERTLALGGLLQACKAAHEIAQLGMTSNDKLDLGCRYNIHN